MVWQVSPSFRLNLSVMGGVMHCVPDIDSGFLIDMTRSRTRGSGSLPFAFFRSYGLGWCFLLLFFIDLAILSGIAGVSGEWAS